MQQKYITHLLTILFLFIGYTNLFAADTVSRKYPRILLVQLRAEKNRIEALTKDRQYKALEMVKTDARNIAKVMTEDFNSNFHYCPVYYYMDSNAEFIRNKQFEGILLKADGSIAQNVPLNSNSEDYLIAYYGYPNLQYKKAGVATEQASTMPGRGLIILNDEYKQIAYFFMLRYSESYFRNRSIYYYNSKKFDMNYFSFVDDLDSKLRGSYSTTDFRGHLNKKHKKNKVRVDGSIPSKR